MCYAFSPLTLNPTSNSFRSAQTLSASERHLFSNFHLWTRSKDELTLFLTFEVKTSFKYFLYKIKENVGTKLLFHFASKSASIAIGLLKKMRGDLKTALYDIAYTLMVQMAIVFARNTNLVRPIFFDLLIFAVSVR